MLPPTTSQTDLPSATSRPARPETTGAALLVDELVRSGVRTIFGVPGDTGVALYDALHGRSAKIRHVLARDERHAVAMADAYARLKNEVGVVEVSSGGGTTYAVGGLGEAYAASVPVLVVASDIHTDSRGSGALTEVDQRALFSAVTKAQHIVDSADAIPTVLAAALAEATGDRPAPVALIVPENVLDEDVRVASHPPSAITVPRVRSGASESLVDRAARLLARAARPAVLAGGGVHVSSAYASLEALATAAGAGVATTIQGKGAIAETHPYALGIAGNNGGSVGVNAFLSNADVVLLVGTRANATDTDSFTAPPPTTSIVRLDIDDTRTKMNYPAAIRLVGDARTVLDAIVARLPLISAEEADRRSRAVAAARADRRPEPDTSPAKGLLLARDVVESVQAICDDDVTVVADPGTPTPNVASYWILSRPGRAILVPRGHGPMGYAVPAAVGAAFARPGQPVVTFTADGSFAMCCGELETIARLSLPIVMIQMTNHSLGWIKMLQHLYAERRYFGVDPGPIDAVGVATACGVRATRVVSLDELRDAVADGLARRAPLYIDVNVPHMIDVVPPVPAWHRALDGDNRRPVY